MTTWEELINLEREESGDQSPMVHVAVAGRDDYDWNTREFDSGYGSEQGVPFTMWTEQRVYFPVVYDGAEWVASVPRNPCKEATNHVGGG